MKSHLHRFAAWAVAGALCAAPALAQFSQLITDFENDGAGDSYPIQPGSLGDLAVVVFQDPAEADVTTLNVLDDSFATQSNGSPPLPSTEESFVASFAGFGGAFGTSQFMNIRFEWTDPNNPDRWALVETLQSPTLGDPSIHLDGRVRFYINIPDCAQFEYPGLFDLTPEIGVALLVSETGRNVPMGFQDNDVLAGSFEFVGVDSVQDPNSANPVPVPSRFIPITDANCVGATTGPAGNWRLVEFDLSTENVVGWTARGGDGVLDATGSGDGVNRGVLAGIVLTVRATDTSSNFAEVLIDQITFESPVNDPAIAPAIASPVVSGDTVVQVNEVVARATNVILEIDRSDADNMDPFVADDTFSVNPGLSTTGEARFTTLNVAPALAIGDRLRARQVVGGNTSANSLIVTVNPPAAFTATLSLDEDGTLGTVAVFEWVGATSVIAPAGTQGKPIFPQNGVWQKLEFSLIPGVEPVISFAGGNGQLEPDGGLYNIDAMFFTIDSSNPSTGPYDMFLDHVYYIDENDQEVVISDAESFNPFPNFRGQSTSINRSSILSGLASYDGLLSNRQQWEFPDTQPNNTSAPFRPAVTFADSAKAVGMYLLVEDPRTSPLQLPAVEQRIIGDAPAVTVNNIDPTATDVELLVNGAPAGNANPGGAASIAVAPTVVLALGDSISARYSTASDTSDMAYARVVQRPAAPVVQGPLVAGQTTVTVTGVLNTGNAVASQVSVFEGANLIGTANPGGQSSVSVSIAPALTVGSQITARQTVNGAQSLASGPVGVGTGEALCVVINEFSFDDSGADNREFVELYNPGPDPVDISNWTLRASGTEPLASKPNIDYTIPAATMLAADDYYVLGDPSVANVDQALPGGNLWQDGQDAIELLDQNGVVVDTVIYELNKGPVTISPAEGGIWGNFTSIDGNAQSLSRWLDGYDTNNNGRDFGMLPISPGATNSIPSLAPYVENFTGTIDDVVPNWIGSFVRLAEIDPTQISALNPNVIPASPQGGNAAVCWDPAGGGNQCALIDEARYNVGFSCQIYIDVTGGQFTPGNFGGELDQWSIGLGTVLTFHNLFDPFTANGNTGLMWQFYIIEDPNDTGNVASATLDLVDRNDSGPDPTVLFSVPTSDLTTGWHTISIVRNYENYTASFDALNTSGTIALPGPSALQMGYREASSGVPAGARPPTIDALTVTVPAPPTLGACFTSCGCELLTEATCDSIGGMYSGDGSSCDAQPCPGDIDGMNGTDLNDLLILLGTFGNPGGPADIDGMNGVDLNDLLILLGDFGCMP